MRLVDPAKLDRIVRAVDAAEGDEPDAPGELSDPRKQRLYARLRSRIERLSVREQSVVSMQLSGLKQREIASILGLTQPTVSYVSMRAKRKMRMMGDWEGIDLSSRDVRAELDTYFEPRDIDVLVSIFETTCHSETARLMRLSQRDVHRVHMRAIEKMQSLPGLARAARVFGWLRDNYRLSHYARGRGKWARRGKSA